MENNNSIEYKEKYYNCCNTDWWNENKKISNENDKRVKEREKRRKENEEWFMKFEERKKERERERVERIKENEERIKENEKWTIENDDRNKEYDDWKKKNDDWWEKYEFGILRNHIITAIYDLYDYFKLNDIIILDEKTVIRLKQHADSSNTCPYFHDEIDSKHLISCKKIYLLNKLKELNNDQIKKIRFYNFDSNILNDIIKYLENNIDKNIIINDDKLEDIIRWWKW